jgi:uncharacterized coiled-coil protein SlyX
MNEDVTQNLPDQKSFEDRVFARFDAFDARFDSVDARFDSVDARLEKLESRNYDTKPIWERALKAIMETGFEVGELKTKVSVIETKVEILQNEFGTMKTGTRDGLVDVRRVLKHSVGDRLDMIHKVLLENRDDIRDAEDRIRDLESKLA